MEKEILRIVSLFDKSTLGSECESKQSSVEAKEYKNLRSITEFNREETLLSFISTLTNIFKLV